MDCYLPGSSLTWCCSVLWGSQYPARVWSRTQHCEQVVKVNTTWRKARTDRRCSKRQMRGKSVTAGGVTEALLRACSRKTPHYIDSYVRHWVLFKRGWGPSASQAPCVALSPSPQPAPSPLHDESTMMYPWVCKSVKAVPWAEPGHWADP